MLQQLNFCRFLRVFSKPENPRILEAIFQPCSVELDDDESQGVQQHH